jgi:ribosomal protein L37AE/L43A
MKIKRKISQNRRDFTAIYECEHCGNEEKSSGYDDSYFHNEVIPKMECNKCGAIAGKDYLPLATKYPDGQVV